MYALPRKRQALPRIFCHHSLLRRRRWVRNCLTKGIRNIMCFNSICLHRSCVVWHTRSTANNSGPSSFRQTRCSQSVCVKMRAKSCPVATTTSAGKRLARGVYDGSVACHGGTFGNLGQPRQSLRTLPPPNLANRCRVGQLEIDIRR